MIEVLYIIGPKGCGKSTYIRSLTNKLFMSAKYDIVFSHDVFEQESFSYILRGRNNFRDSENYDLQDRIRKTNYKEKHPNLNDWIIINSAADDGGCVTYFKDHLLSPVYNTLSNTDVISSSNLLIITAIRPDENRPNSLHKQIREAIQNVFKTTIKELYIDLSPISVLHI